MGLTPLDDADLARRFWPKLTGDGDCWVWTAARDTSGYGAFNARTPLGFTKMGAHRIAYMALVGEIPDGLVVDHLCRNRPCVNPWHMEIVPSRINTLRGETRAAQNASLDTCRRGHSFIARRRPDRSVGQSRRCRECSAAATRRYQARRAAA